MLRVPAYLCAMPALQKYFISYSIFLAAVALGLYAYIRTQPAEHVHPLAWPLFGFFAVVYLLSHLFLLNAEDKKAGVFIRRFMGTSSLRLFVFLLILVFYAFANHALATLFIWHFLAFYFPFTVFEIASLYGHFRPKK